MSVTTATLWVCSKCGFVSHLDGTGPAQAVSYCAHGNDNRHSLKQVLVVVPYA